MPNMRCHPAKMWIFFLANKTDILQIELHPTQQQAAYASSNTHPHHTHSAGTTKHRSPKHPNTFRNFFQRPLCLSLSLVLCVASSSEAADLLCSGSLHRLMVESLSTHCPISISKAGTDSYPSGRENCIYILMST